jgi:hypothetical protein
MMFHACNDHPISQLQQSPHMSIYCLLANSIFFAIHVSRTWKQIRLLSVISSEHGFLNMAGTLAFLAVRKPPSSCDTS